MHSRVRTIDTGAADKEEIIRLCPTAVVQLVLLCVRRGGKCSSYVITVKSIIQPSGSLRLGSGARLLPTEHRKPF